MSAEFRGRTTTAAVLREVGRPLSVEEVEIADPGPGEVLVRLAASGLCHSDLHVIQGDWETALPVVLGHEGAGVVEAVGEGVRRVAVGDQVVLSWTSGCEVCRFCVTGRPHLCTNLDTTVYQNVLLDGTPRLRTEAGTIYTSLALGAFARHAVVPETGAIPVGDAVPLDLAAIVGCAVTTGFGAASKTVHVPVGASAVVIGLGGVGLSALQGCVAQSASPVIAVDVHDDKLALATKLGATHVVNGASQDPVAAVMEITGGRGADFVFEAIGLKATIQQMLAMLARQGTAVMVGAPATGITLEVDPNELISFERRIVGSNYGSANPAVDFPRLLELSTRGHVDLDALVTRRIGLDEINDGFEAMQRGEGVRTVIVHG
jgi:S-(hydroxymethyl)glutathione dehydrogenase/alcohol dehydrogenase